MSIQKVIKQNIFTKFQNFFTILGQFLYRSFFYDRPRVFFRYKTKNTHPSFDRFYTKKSISWVNLTNYDVAHWINYPAWCNQQPYFVEINDHPLSTVSYKHRGLSEPGEILKYVDDALAVYANPMCRKILAPCDGFERLYKYYFGELFTEKFYRLHSPGCIPKVSEVQNSVS